jgi:hypothetical protein
MSGRIKAGENQMKAQKPIALMLLSLPVIAACLFGTSPRPALKFDPEELPAGQLNIPYEIQVQVSQNATPVFNMFISEGALPEGLTLEYVENDDFAKITGTPGEAGTFKFAIAAMCYGTSVNGQMGQMEYTIVVH